MFKKTTEDAMQQYSRRYIDTEPMKRLMLLSLIALAMFALGCDTSGRRFPNTVNNNGLATSPNFGLESTVGDQTSRAVESGGVGGGTQGSALTGNSALFPGGYTFPGNCSALFSGAGHAAYPNRPAYWDNVGGGKVTGNILPPYVYPDGSAIHGPNGLGTNSNDYSAPHARAAQLFDQAAVALAQGDRAAAAGYVDAALTILEELPQEDYDYVISVLDGAGVDYEVIARGDFELERAQDREAHKEVYFQDMPWHRLVEDWRTIWDSVGAWAEGTAYNLVHGQVVHPVRDVVVSMASAANHLQYGAHGYTGMAQYRSAFGKIRPPGC